MGGVHTLDVTGFESVEALKNHVCQLEGIDEIDNQILNLNGSPLIEEEPLSACGLSEMATIEMTSRLLEEKCMVLSPEPVKSRGRRPKSRNRKRKRRRLAEPGEGSNTTGDLST